MHKKIFTRCLKLAMVIFCLTANADETFTSKFQHRIELDAEEYLQQFNNDSSALITCRGGIFNFYDLNTGIKNNSIVPEKGHECVTVSRDSKLLATVKVIINDPTAKYGHDTIFHLWDVTGSTPKLLHKFKTKDGGGGEFSPDNRWFVNYGPESSFAQIWDVSNGNLVRKIDIHQGRIESISFSSDSKLFVISGEGVTQLWQTDQWKRLKQTLPRSSKVLLSPDGKYLASSEFTINKIRLNVWDIQNSKWHWSKPVDNCQDISTFNFSKSGKLLAYTGEKATYLYSVDTGKKLHTYPQEAHEIAFSPDGKHFALTASEGKSGYNYKHVIYLYASPEGSAVFE